MAQFPYWASNDLTDEATWNFMWLGGSFLPGLIQNCTAEKGRKIDEASPKGSDGAVTTDQGYSGGAVEFDLLITNQDEWDAFQEMLPNIDPQKPGGQVEPLEILHPEPNAIGIKTVRIAKITGYQPKQGGAKRYHFSCKHWLPKLKTANVSTTANTKDEPTNSPARNIPLIVPDFTQNTFGP